MRRTLHIVSIVFIICVCLGASGTTWYVDNAVSASGDGTPERPFKRIQQGIDAASDGDAIAVAEGTYTERIHFNGKNIALRSTNPLDPDVVSNTVIDAAKKSGPVVTFAGTEDEICVLSGFTIRNGRAEDGGGICGGTWESCTHATIENNMITGNSAAFGSGGLAFCDGVINDNRINSNSAYIGGALGWCDGTILNNRIADNGAVKGGGGLAYCDGTIQRNRITGNSATDQLGAGGGLAYCHGTVQNNIISGNSVRWEGGALFVCDGMILNNTITRNSSDVNSGGLNRCCGVIRNCIIWRNAAPSLPQLLDCTEPGYSCIDGWSGGGERNIDDDPQFVDPDGSDNNINTYEDNDYRLSAISLCIDKAMNEHWMWQAVDREGNPRIVRGTLSMRVDMGAYEYGSFPFAITEVLKTTGVELTWASRPGDTYTVWSCLDLETEEWSEETTIPSAGETTSWSDPDMTSPGKFYRIEIK